MLATKSPILQMLNEQIDVLSLSPVERKLYESRMKLKSDIATISEEQFNAGLQEGKREGKREGKLEGKLETARLMLQRKYPLTEICLMTGLSQTEVEALN